MQYSCVTGSEPEGIIGCLYVSGMKSNRTKTKGSSVVSLELMGVKNEYRWPQFGKKVQKKENYRRCGLC